MAELIHDTRNLAAAIGLYCDLLGASGVLNPTFAYLAGDLQIVAGSSRRLLDRMALLDASASQAGEGKILSLGNAALTAGPESLQLNLGANSTADRAEFGCGTKQMSLRSGISLVGRSYQGEVSQAEGDAGRPNALLDPVTPVFTVGGLSSSTQRVAQPAWVGFTPALRSPALNRESDQPGDVQQTVKSLSGELRANYRILTALVGPGISVGLSIEGGDRPVGILADDLTRVLVNLARNAAEAMPTGGHLQISLRERDDALILSFADTGSGIAPGLLETIFTAGFTSHVDLEADSTRRAAACRSSAQHRGYGLAIVRSLVTDAGGSVWAANSRSSHILETNRQENGRLLSSIRSDAGNRSVAAQTVSLKPRRIALSQPVLTGETGAIITLQFPIAGSKSFPERPDEASHST